MAGVKIPQSEYRSHPAISKSDLFKITKSPLHFKWAMENRERETPSLIFGRACHKYVLEKESFYEELRNTKENMGSVGSRVLRGCRKNAPACLQN